MLGARGMSMYYNSDVLSYLKLSKLEQFVNVFLVSSLELHTTYQNYGSNIRNGKLMISEWHASMKKYQRDILNNVFIDLLLALKFFNLLHFETHNMYLKPEMVNSIYLETR